MKVYTKIEEVKNETNNRCPFIFKYWYLGKDIVAIKRVK